MDRSAEPTRHPEATRHPERDQYTGTAKALHWTVLGLLVVQFIVAWTMPGAGRDTQPETLINLHLSFGTLIILVMALRLVWRLTHPAPPPPDGLPGWQLLASRTVHGLLYALLFAVPILGWINASYRGWNVTLFGLVPLPGLIAPRSANAATAVIGRWSGDVHIWTSYVLLGAIALHVLGALYHRFVLHDAILARMLPHAGNQPALARSADRRSTAP